MSVIGWIFIIGCVVTIVLYWRVGSASVVAVVNDDTCAQCGYIVHGLPQPICPECGSDLSLPGAVRRRGSPAHARLPWWGPLGPPALAATYLVVAGFVLEQAPRIYPLTTSRVWADPYSKAFGRVKITYSGDVYKNAALSGGLARIILTMNDDTSAALEVEPHTGRYRSVSGPATMAGTTFSPDVFLRWAQACGLNTADVGVAEEMGVIEIALRQVSPNPSPRYINSSMSGGKPFRSVSYSSWSGPNRRTYFVMAAHVLLALGWIGGTAWLVRRARGRSHTPAAVSVL